MTLSKNVWYLHHYAGAPSIGMSYRPFYLSKYLNQMGIKTSIIAASFHHLRIQQKRQKQLVAYEMIDGLPYVWLKACQYQHNSVRRLWNMFNYSLRLFTQRNKLIKLLGKPDVIIVSSTHSFHYLTARRLAKKYNAKLIFEVRDLWPLSLIELLNKNLKHPLIALMSYIEKKAYREADYVVSLLSNAFAYMKPLGLEEQRYRYIPNGVDALEIEDNLSLPDSLSQKIDKLKAQNKFIIAYVGAHGIPNALEQFIEAMKILQDLNRHKVFAILVGDGMSKQDLKEKAKNLNNVFFHDAILKKAIPTLLQKADACFLGWRDKHIYHYGVSPNKVFDYMLATKPIIQAINSSNDPVALAECGIIVPAEQPTKLADALESLANMNKQALNALGERGRDYVMQHHTYQHLANRYAELLTTC